jgi:hypothetical protein
VHRGAAAYTLRLWLLATCVLAVVACGGGGGAQAEKEQPKAHAIPQQPGKALAPGKYTTEVFEPRLSFEVGQGWAVSRIEGPDRFSIAWRNSGAGYDPTLYFHEAPSEVYSPRKPDEFAPVPAPKKWVAWFRGHPYLEVGEPQAVSVGGVEGRQIVLSVDLLPGEDYDSVWCGGSRSVALWPIHDGLAWCAAEGTVDQIIVLEDVGGKTVFLDLGAEAGKFEDFVPRAEKVLDTVKWEGK